MNNNLFRSALNYLTSLLLIGLITLVLWLLRDRLSLENFSLIYLLAIFLLAIWLGTGPSLFAAALSFMSFNFFLIRPYYTLYVEDSRDLIDLLIFLVVAVVTGQLTAYARRQAQNARQLAVEEAILYQLSSAFNQLTTHQEIYATLRQVIREDLQAIEVNIMPEITESIVSVGATTPVYVLLQAGDHIYGTVQAQFHTVTNEAHIRLLRACVVQAAMALQRINLTTRAQQSQTLEEADKLKTALLQAVSHDLRTPLTIIKTSASNLRTLQNQLTAQQQLEMVNAIDQEVDHLNELVGNLLDMSRLKAGAMVINSDWYALAEIANDAAARAWQRSSQERIRLNFADDLPLARYDYGLMLQALTNIVDNVLRYEPEGQQVEIRGEADAHELRWVIINHGPAIPEAEKQRIMEPFYHGPDGHVGLGLAISQGIVEAHRGRMWIEDTMGGGATFIIALPLPPPGNSPLHSLE